MFSLPKKSVFQHRLLQIILSITISTGLLLANPAQAYTILVDETVSLEDLNSEKLTPGDQILFNRGDTWEGHIRAQAGVHYGAYGSGPDPVIHGNEYCVLGYDVDNVTIENLIFRNFTSTGIYVSNSHRWIIRNNYFESPVAERYAIWIRTTLEDVLLVDHLIENNEFGQLGNAFSDSVRVAAINLSDTQNATVKGNYIHTVFRPAIRTMRGTGSANSSRTRILDNYITNSWGNILIWSTDDAVVKQNIIINSSGCGICVSFGSSRTRILENRIHALGKSTNLWNGIDVNGDTSQINGGTILENRISAVNCHSIMLSSASGWQVLHNRLDASGNTSDGCYSRRLAIRLKNSTVLSNYNSFIPNGDGDGDLSPDVFLLNSDGVLMSLATWVETSLQDQNSTVR